MAVVFYVIGWIGIVIAAGWTALVLAQPTYDAAYTTVAMTRIFAIAPGVGLALSSLLFIAIGGVLGRLDRLIENTGDWRLTNRAGNWPSFD